MDFLAAANNVTDKKEVPDREEVEGMAWGIKRFLSMHPRLLPTVAFLDQFYFTLGAERFYELMVYCMPQGRYYMRSVKKDEDVVKPDVDDALARRVCQYFKISSSEIPVLLRVVDLAAMKAAFGVEAKPTVRRRPARKGRG